MTELTNTMTKQELIATQNVNNMENGTLVSRIEQNEQDISQIADYVIERGTTDGWEWEKWASGKAIAISTNQRGNYFETAVNGVRESYIVSRPTPIGLFASVQHCNVTAFLPDGCWCSPYAISITEVSCKYYTLNPNIASTGGSLTTEIIGTWK